IHWLKRRERGQDLEAAIVVGAPPTVAMTAVAKLPYGVDEYAVAGALSGEPIELVRCETVDLEVPAHAEIVIEGRIPTRYLEPEGALNMMVIRLKKRSPAQPTQALLAAAALEPTYGKILIAVDEDIDPYDLDAVMWACSTRMQPHLDVTIIRNRASMLDPSA